MSTQKLETVLAITLALASMTIFPASAQSLPDPPSAPPPAGHPTPEGTFGPPPQCKRTPKELNALIPEKELGSLLKGQGFTTSQYPNFWVYVPYAPEDIYSGEFSLHNRKGHTLYQTYFSLHKTPGIVSIPLPLDPKNALEEGKFYHWYFTLNCGSNKNSKPDLVKVDGWVKRVALTPDYEDQINTAQPDIWYDALTRLANLRLTSPQDDNLKNDWKNLLNSVGLDKLVQEQLVSPVLLKCEITEYTFLSYDLDNIRANFQPEYKMPSCRERSHTY